VPVLLKAVELFELAVVVAVADEVVVAVIKVEDVEVARAVTDVVFAGRETVVVTLEEILLDTLEVMLVVLNPTAVLELANPVVVKARVVDEVLFEGGLVDEEAKVDGVVVADEVLEVAVLVEFER
jgi:hypothetical protein